MCAAKSHAVVWLEDWNGSWFPFTIPVVCTEPPHRDGKHYDETFSREF